MSQQGAPRATRTSSSAGGKSGGSGGGGGGGGGGGKSGGTQFSDSQLKRAIRVAAEQAARPTVPYVLSRETCAIPKIIRCRQVIALTINSDLYHASGATSINQFMPRDDNSHTTLALLVQLFGRIAEVAISAVSVNNLVKPPTARVTRIQKKHTKKTRAKKKKAAAEHDTKDAYDDMSDDDDDAAGGDMTDDDDDDAGGDMTDDDDDDVQRASAVRERNDGMPVQVFLETLVRASVPAETSNDPFNLKPAATGVRLWITNSDPAINLDALTQDIFAENEKREQKRVEAALSSARGRSDNGGGGGGGGGGGAASDESGDVPHDQLWRRLTKRDDIARVFDYYIKYTYATQGTSHLFNDVATRNGETPMSVTRALNPAWALYNAGEETLSCQGTFADDDCYVQMCLDAETNAKMPRRDANGHMLLRFPLPEFVYRLPASDCNSYGLFYRDFAVEQQQRWTDLGSLFPEDFAGMRSDLQSGSDASGMTNRPLYVYDYEMPHPLLAAAAAARSGAAAVTAAAHPIESRRLNFAAAANAAAVSSSSTAEANSDDAALEASLVAGGYTRQEARRVVAEASSRSVTATAATLQMRRNTAPTSVPATRAAALFQRATAFGLFKHLPPDDVDASRQTMTRYDCRSTIATTKRLFRISDEEMNKFDRFEYTSAFAVLHRDSATVRHAIDALMKRFASTHSPDDLLRRGLGSAELQARVARLIAQHTALESYDRACRSPDSVMSPTACIVHTYRLMSNCYARAHTVRPAIFDPSMGSFANHLCATMIELTDTFKLSKNAPHCEMLSVVVRDAFRQMYSLHYNVIHYGPGAAGKSNLFDVVEKFMMIQGTMEKLTRQTMAADSVDGIGHDVVRTYHELQMSRFETAKGGAGKGGGGGGGGSDVSSGFKEFVTSMEVRVLVPVLNADGTRDQRTIVRKAISVFLGNTNADFDEVDPAMLSRFHFKSFESGEDDITGILEQMISEAFNESEVNLARQRYKFKMQLFQVLHFEVEKMIHGGVLNQVSQHGGMVFQQLVISWLKQRGVSADNVRVSQRNMLLARLYAISEALYDHFLRPGAPYQNREITVDAFLGLDQRLFIQTHHVVYVLGLTEDQLIPTFDVQVLRGLKHLLASQTDPFQVSQREMQRQKLIAKEERARAQTRTHMQQQQRAAAPLASFHGNGRALPLFVADTSSSSQRGFCEDSLDMSAAASSSAVSFVAASTDAAIASMSDEHFIQIENVAREQRSAKMLCTENNTPIDACYYRFRQSADLDCFILAVLGACKATAHGRNVPTRGMVANCLDRLCKSTYASRMFVFASRHWLGLTREEINMVEAGRFLRVAIDATSMAPMARSTMVQSEFGFSILAEFLDDRINAADDVNGEGLMSAAIRNVLAKRGQHKGIYVMGQEVEGYPSLLKRFCFGPGYTRAEVEHVEGYWRNAHLAATEKQRLHSQAPVTTPWLCARYVRAVSSSCDVLDVPEHELPPMITPNFLYSEEAKKHLRRIVEGNFEMDDSDARWDFDLSGGGGADAAADSENERPDDDDDDDDDVTSANARRRRAEQRRQRKHSDNDHRICSIDVPLDQWAAVMRAKTLSITDEAVPSDLVLRYNVARSVRDYRRESSTTGGAAAADDDDDEMNLNSPAERQRRIVAENNCNGSHSIHREGRSYFCGIEILRDDDDDDDDDDEAAEGMNGHVSEAMKFGARARAQRRRRLDQKIAAVQNLANIEVRPSSDGVDYDFRPEHHYVPLPVRIVRQSEHAQALIAQALTPNPNPGTLEKPLPSMTSRATFDDDDGDGDDDKRHPLWVPFWTLIGMPLSEYKILRYVWFIESARQHLWQLYSGDYPYVQMFYYPGDLYTQGKTASLWDVCSNASSDEFKRLTATSMRSAAVSLRAGGPAMATLEARAIAAPTLTARLAGTLEACTNNGRYNRVLSLSAPDVKLRRSVSDDMRCDDDDDDDDDTALVVRHGRRATSASVKRHKHGDAPLYAIQSHAPDDDTQFDF